VADDSTGSGRAAPFDQQENPFPPVCASFCRHDEARCGAAPGKQGPEMVPQHCGHLVLRSLRHRGRLPLGSTWLAQFLPLGCRGPEATHMMGTCSLRAAELAHRPDVCLLANAGGPLATLIVVRAGRCAGPMPCGGRLYNRRLQEETLFHFRWSSKADRQRRGADDVAGWRR
jgi:hypothetical protein